MDRDDLEDQGASHIAETVGKLKALSGGSIKVEALVGDFNGKMEDVATVALSGLDVFAHNVETVEALQGVVRDRRANWKQSLAVLTEAKRVAKRENKDLITKTSLMLGGETKEQVVAALRVLRAHEVDVVTLGQYMRPTKRHMPVAEYVTPEAFEATSRWRSRWDSCTWPRALWCGRRTGQGKYFMENHIREKEKEKEREAA